MNSLQKQRSFLKVCRGLLRTRSQHPQALSTLANSTTVVAPEEIIKECVTIRSSIQSLNDVSLFLQIQFKTLN